MLSPWAGIPRILLVLAALDAGHACLMWAQGKYVLAIGDACFTGVLLLAVDLIVRHRVREEQRRETLRAIRRDRTENL